MSELQTDQPVLKSIAPDAQTAVLLGVPKTRRFSVHPLVWTICIYAAIRFCPGLAGTVWQMITTVPAETARIEQVLDQTLAAGKARDAQAIYALLSTEAPTGDAVSAPVSSSGRPGRKVNGRLTSQVNGRLRFCWLIFLSTY